MNDQKTGSGKLQLGIIALVFFGPLLVAGWMYATGRLLPAGGSNHGALLTPVVNLVDALAASPVLAASDGQWILLYVNEGDCLQACEQELYRLRQIRLMVGKDMDRVVRVFLHGAAPPDTVFLETQHAGLIAVRDRSLAALLEDKTPAALEPGGLYLIDPMANLVMYFAPDLDPREVVDDIGHLLEFSRIG